MTVVFDAGQNSAANFAHLAGTSLRYVGSVPASDCAGRRAARQRPTVVDEDRFGGLTAYDTRRRFTAPSAGRSSPTHPSCTKSRPADSPAPPWPRRAASWTSWPPPWPAARPAGHARRSKPRSARSCTTRGRAAYHLAAGRGHPERPPAHLGHRPGSLRRARTGDLGKHVLITDHDDCGRRGHCRVPVPVRGRSLLPADERSPRRLLQPDVPLDRAQHRRPPLTCVLALQPPTSCVAAPPGPAGSVRARPARRARRIGETVLLYPGGRGRPRAHRMLTDTTPVQDKLIKISGSTATPPGADMGNTQPAYTWKQKVKIRLATGVRVVDRLRLCDCAWEGEGCGG